MTSIGQSMVITGEVASEEDVAIGGRVRGPITIRNGSLTVRDTGHLAGDIRAARVVVQGTVDGNIGASERIELQASARVTGSLSANHVVIADGATFNGRIDMDQRTIAARVAQFRAGR